ALRSAFVEHFAIPEALAKVAECMDAPGSLRAAEALIPVLKKVEKVTNMEPLRRALVGVCRPLDANGARRVADSIARAVQDPKTPVLARALLANGFAAIVDKVEPDKVAPLESAIVDVLVVDLANANVPTAAWLVPALASVCGHPGTKCAPRAAEALAAAIR